MARVCRVAPSGTGTGHWMGLSGRRCHLLAPDRGVRGPVRAGAAIGRQRRTCRPTGRGRFGRRCRGVRRAHRSLCGDPRAVVRRCHPGRERAQCSGPVNRQITHDLDRPPRSCGRQIDASHHASTAGEMTRPAPHPASSISGGLLRRTSRPRSGRSSPDRMATPARSGRAAPVSAQASPSGHGSRLSGDRAGSRTDASARPAPTHHLTVLPRLLAWRANHGTERHSFTVGRPSTHR